MPAPYAHTVCVGVRYLCMRPDYLSRSCSALLAQHADLVTLGSWTHFAAVDDVLRIYDAGADPHAGHHARKWGYGFSFVYRTEIAQACPFLPIDHGEDCMLVPTPVASAANAVPTVWSRDMGPHPKSHAAMASPPWSLLKSPLTVLSTWMHARRWVRYVCGSGRVLLHSLRGQRALHRTPHWT